jgi:hypothetical protein
MLKDEIESAKRLVNTDTVQITIGEIASMYAAKELDIIPEFQRLFRWSIEKKSSFVESILIGIPIPPAFAYENEDGTWELIDGLQRISTVLEFMGVLRDPDSPGSYKSSTLVAAKYLPSLEGVSWKEETSPKSAMDKALQLFFRRARIDFQVLKHPSDPRTKFDLFQRLNRGGAYANEQEVRTCSMVLANRAFTKAIRDLAETDAFTGVFKITPDQKLTQMNVEYAVRLVVHTFRDFTSGSDVQEFLDRSILSILTEEKVKPVIDTSTWVVETLFRLFGDIALLPPTNAPPQIASRFSLRALECIAVGLGRNMKGIQKLSDSDDFIRQRVNQFWQQKEVLEMSASGLRGTTRLQRSIPFGHAWFKP